MSRAKRKRRLLFRRKRSLDPSIVIDYKEPDQLKRFITDRGKIIPRRISGATSAQQRQITRAVKRARYMSLLPYTVAHDQEKKAVIDVALAAAAAASRRSSGPRGDMNRDRAPAPAPAADKPAEAAPAEAAKTEE